MGDSFQKPVATSTVSGSGALKVDVVQTVSSGGGGDSGGLTDAELRASPVPVSGTVGVSGTVVVSGTVTANVGTGTQPVSGTVTANAGTGPWPVTDNGGSLTVDGTFWQATQPVSIASAVPVTDNGGSLTVDGSVSVSNFPASQAVTGTFWQATQPVSIASAVSLASMAAASNTPAGVFTLGNTLGKTNVMRTGTLASSAVTADQAIHTYSVTAGKTFYLTYFDVTARLTTFAATATFFGTASVESPSGTKLYTTEIFHAGNMQPAGVWFAEPVPIAAGSTIRVVCTPSATTAFTWRANFGGYEK